MEGNLLKIDPKYQKIVKSLNIKTTKSGKYVNDPYKIMYMIENGEIIVVDENGNPLYFKDIFEKIDIDPFKYSIYRYFKRRGFNVLIDENITIEKGDIREKIFIKRPYENVTLDFSGILALVDDYFENTFYSFDDIEIKGTNTGSKDEKDSLFNESPKFIDDEMRIVHDFMVEKGLSLKSGMKFGCEFIGYENPSDEHSKYMIKVVRNGMTYIEAAGLSRVAHATKKILVLVKISNGMVESKRAMKWIRI